MTPISSRTQAALAPAAWGVAAMAIGAVLAALEPNLLEEGAHLHIAQRLADGERLYRDVIFFTGPLPFEFLALLFRLLGDELFVARGVVVALQGVATATTYVIARRASAGVLAHAAAAVLAFAPALGFPMLSVYFYTTIAFYLVPLAVYLGLRSGEAPRFALGAGALLACVALSKQTLGLALLISLGAAIVASAERGARVKMLGWLALGGCAVAGFTLGLYTALGSLGDLVQATLVMPLTLSETFDVPFPNLWPIARFDEEILRSAYLYIPKLYYALSGHSILAPRFMLGITQLLYALPFAALLATLLARGFGPLPKAVWLHAAALLALVTNLYPRADWGHLVFVLPATLVQLHLLWPRKHSVRLRRRRGAAIASAAVLASGGLASCALLYARSGPASFGPRVPLRPVSQSYKESNLPRVIEYLRQHAEESEAIFVARQEPLIYFATDTKNPTPFVGAISGHRDAQERVILPALDEVRYVVMSDIDQPGYHFYAEQLPLVQMHLERFFHIPSDFPSEPGDWLQLYERGADRGETLVDLQFAYRLKEPWIRAWQRDGKVERDHDSLPIHFATRRLRRPVPVSLGSHGGGIDFAFAPLPEDAVFQGFVGLRAIKTSAGALQHPTGVRMIVSVGQDGVFEELYRRRISSSPLAGSRWRSVEVDLSAFGGRDATLRLEVLPYDRRQQGALAWWGSPRLARRTPAAAPAADPTVALP